jgi:RNA polymerase sigma-70 factor (ECF subfamily)
MNEFAGRLAGPLVTTAEDTETREFEARLADSSALAFRVAFSVLRQRQDAEDVAQQAFVRAYRRFASLRDRERFRSWLVRMTWRLALDHRRGEKRRLVREDHAAAPLMTTSTVETDALADERRRRLWAAIDQLPEKLRLVIVLAAIEEQSVRDIASLAKVPEGTVKSRLFDARKRLQEMLR